jgi:hypothetical protein
LKYDEMALKICAHPSLLPWPIDISSDSFFGRTKKPVVECPNKKNVFLNSFIFFPKQKQDRLTHLLLQMPNCDVIKINAFLPFGRDWKIPF